MNSFSRKVLLPCAAALLLLSGLAQAATAVDDAACEAALDKVISVEFQEVQLDNVIEHFRRVSGLNIVAKWASILNTGIDQDSPVTLNLKNVPIRTALSACLQSMDAMGLIGFAVKDGLVTIAWDETLRTPEFLVTKVYAVADFFEGDPPQEAIDLLDCVRTMVDPFSWDTYGQTTYIGGMLMVTQSYANQRAVGKLLDTLRSNDIRIQTTAEQQAKQAEPRMALVKNMTQVCFNPEAMAVVAIGGLRTELPREPEEIVKALAALLETTKTPGLRNAIRLTMKDIYVEMDDAANAEAQLQAIVRENDAMLTDDE